MSNVEVGTRVPRSGALLCTVVAGVEAAALVLGGVLALADGVQGGSLPLGLAVGAVALALAYLLGRVAVASWRGRTWQRGVLVTTQLLAGLVALSVGSPALAAPLEAPRAALLTAAVLVLAAAGLVGVWLTTRGGAVDRA